MTDYTTPPPNTEGAYWAAKIAQIEADGELARRRAAREARETSLYPIITLLTSVAFVGLAAGIGSWIAVHFSVVVR